MSWSKRQAGQEGLTQVSLSGVDRLTQQILHVWGPLNVGPLDCIEAHKPFHTVH